MKKSTVDKWQQGRAGWNYSPALQFWHRFTLFTLADAMQLRYLAGLSGLARRGRRKCAGYQTRRSSRVIGSQPPSQALSKRQARVCELCGVLPLARARCEC